VTRVIDGDSLDARVTRDLGFGGSATFVVRLRLNRINAAPIKTDLGEKAKQFVVDELTPTGGVVDLTTVGPYKFGGPSTSPGEWMAEIVLTDGTNLSDALVKAGLAVYWDGQGPRPLGDR